MRTLQYTIDLEQLRRIKEEIVPVLFTEHQFHLIEKKMTNKKMTQSEKNEFSRTVSRKMKAINKITEKETRNIFIYGENKIRKDRLKLAVTYLKQFSRKFKNRHVLISGSFLYNKLYHDIDIFVVSKYEKEDYKEGKFHINYLEEKVYNSLFFASLKKLCISNKIISFYPIKENINISTLISLYQELFNEFDRKFNGIKSTLREFLLQAAYIEKSPIFDSSELSRQSDALLKIKEPQEIIKRVFVNSVVIGINKKEAVPAMKNMVNSYKGVIKEYSQHKKYYLNLMAAFNEVIAIES